MIAMGRKSLALLGGFLIGAGAGSLAGTFAEIAHGDHKSTPCAKHPAKITAAQRERGRATRAECIRQFKRDNTPWPRNPEWWEIAQRRATPLEVRTLRRIAECEQPGDGVHNHPITTGPPTRWAVRWSHPGPRYVSAFGMWSGTWRIGSAVTGSLYPPNATPAEELAVALVVARRFGFSAWGCA